MTQFTIKFKIYLNNSTNSANHNKHGKKIAINETKYIDK